MEGRGLAPNPAPASGCGLQSHYIRYCQQLHREAKARAAKFEGGASKLPGSQQPRNETHVRFVDVAKSDDDTVLANNQFQALAVDDESITDDESVADFQTGRR